MAAAGFGSPRVPRAVIRAAGSLRTSAARRFGAVSFPANRPNGLPLETLLELDFDPGGV